MGDLIVTAGGTLEGVRVQQGSNIGSEDGRHARGGVEVGVGTDLHDFNDHVALTANGTLTVVGGSQKVTDSPDNVSAADSDNPLTIPDGSATSTVPTSQKTGDSVVALGGDIGLNFRFGPSNKININPFLWGRVGHYIGTQYPARDFEGPKPLGWEELAGVGVRAGYSVTNSVSIYAEGRAGWGNVTAKINDEVGSNNVPTNMLSGGLGVSITPGAKPAENEPAITGREAALEGAQKIHDHIMDEVGADLKACGYPDVKVNVYETENFDGTHLSAIPDVAGWYYNIEPLIANTDGSLHSVGGESNSSAALDGKTEFTSAENFIAWIKAEHAADAAAAAPAPATTTGTTH
jgi:hypothetical protein